MRTKIVRGRICKDVAGTFHVYYNAGMPRRSHVEKPEEGPPEIPGYLDYLAKEGEFPPQPKPLSFGEKFRIPDRKEGELKRQRALERPFLCPYPGCGGKQPIGGSTENLMTKCQCNRNPRHRWIIQWDSEELDGGRIIMDSDAPMFEFPDER